VVPCRRRRRPPLQAALLYKKKAPYMGKMYEGKSIAEDRE